MLTSSKSSVTSYYDGTSSSPSSATGKSPFCHLSVTIMSPFSSDPTSIPGITIDMPDYDDMEYSGDFDSNEASGLTDDEDL